MQDEAGIHVRSSTGFDKNFSEALSLAEIFDLTTKVNGLRGQWVWSFFFGRSLRAVAWIRWP